VSDRAVAKRLESLISRSIRQTRSGAIEWRTTDDEAAFLFSGESASLLVKKHEGRMGPMPLSTVTAYKLSVLNERGVEVESLDSTFYRAQLNSDELADENAPAHETRWLPTDRTISLRNLWQAARRSALRVDNILDLIITEIGEAKRSSEGDQESNEPERDEEEGSSETIGELEVEAEAESKKVEE
jgi:hypothetical protein